MPLEVNLPEEELKQSNDSKEERNDALGFEDDLIGHPKTED